MSITVEQFGAECHDFLKADPGPKGIENVRRRLEDVLLDEEFVETYLGDHEDAARKVIYEDPELKFCILAHVQKGKAAAPPHDHGDSWAIYGVAKGAITMHIWDKTAPPDGEKPGKATEVRSFYQSPGMASAWNVGDLHSPSREEEARLIRIEGRNLEGAKRDRYEPA